MHKIYPVLICSLLFSCSQKRGAGNALVTIDVNPNSSSSIELVDISSTVEQVPLETTENSHIVHAIGVVQFNEKLLIQDLSEKVLMFSGEGSFLRQIGKSGNGPGEYRQITGLAVDPPKSRIYIASGRKLLCFDAENHLRYEKQLPYFSEYLQYQMEENELWVFSQNLGVDIGKGKFANESQVFKYNENMEIKDSILVKRVVLAQESASIYPYKHYITTLAGQDFLYYPVLTQEKILRDTLYGIEGDKLNPSLKLDFGENFLDEKGNKSIHIKNIYRSRDYVVCEYSSKNGNYMFVYSLQKEEGWNLKDGITTNEGEGVFLRPFDPSANRFYFLTQIPANGKEEPNPTVHIVTLN